MIFASRNFFLNQKISRSKNWFFKILIFCSEKNPIIFSKFFFAKIFWCRKNIFWKKFLPVSTQNFLRIPKIVLRKPCDEPKHAKTSTLALLYIWNTGNTHPVTTPGSPPTRATQAGFGVMEHFFSQNARQNLNCSPRWRFRLTSGFLWWIDT